MVDTQSTGATVILKQRNKLLSIVHIPSRPSLVYQMPEAARAEE